MYIPLCWYKASPVVERLWIHCTLIPFIQLLGQGSSSVFHNSRQWEAWVNTINGKHWDTHPIFFFPLSRHWLKHPNLCEFPANSILNSIIDMRLDITSGQRWLGMLSACQRFRIVLGWKTVTPSISSRSCLLVSCYSCSFAWGLQSLHPLLMKLNY